MGTETHQLIDYKYILFFLYVKLNNPQMGTETPFLLASDSVATGCVKLNNPQMGTETCSFSASSSIVEIYMLN